MCTNKAIFVACPIGDEGTATREHADYVLTHLIKETISHFQLSDLDVIRADKVAKAGKITTQIIRNLIEADVVISDLSELNPNVMYEIGIRQALLKPYILIAPNGTALPFDLKDSRTIFYDTSSVPKMHQARDLLGSLLKDALDGKIDPYDENLFGKFPEQEHKKVESQNYRLLETLEEVIIADRKTADAVDALSRRLSSAINEIESLFTTGYGGAGSYLYISGENQAFSALVAALSRAKESVKTTRYSPYAVGTRQSEFSQMIFNRVLGLNQCQPLQSFFRIVSANDISKIDDIEQYFKEFIGKQFVLYLTPHPNNFELVIIDDKEVFIHFHDRDKIIDSTLHVIGEKVAFRFGEIYSSLHDPTIHPDVKKYDFKYISGRDSDNILKEIESYFQEYCPRSTEPN